MTFVNIPFSHPLAEEISDDKGETHYNSWAVASVGVFGLLKHPENKEIEQKIIDLSLLSPGVRKEQIFELIKMVKKFKQEAAIRELQAHIAEGFEVFAHKIHEISR